MIIPIIAATSRDLLRQVPETTKEAAEALGMTDTEVFARVQARWIRSGVIGAAVLGLGRALGETIAVAIISGSQDEFAHNIYGVMSSIAAFIVSNLDAAQVDPSHLAVKAIAELALVLMAITLISNVIARFIVNKSTRRAGGHCPSEPASRWPSPEPTPPVPSKVARSPPDDISRSRQDRATGCWWALCALGLRFLGHSRLSGSSAASSTTACGRWHWSVIWTAQRGSAAGSRTTSSARR